MRKPELAAAIAESADLSKDKAGQVLNVILDEITNSVAKGEDVALIGFGTFCIGYCQNDSLATACCACLPVDASIITHPL